MFFNCGKIFFRKPVIYYLILICAHIHTLITVIILILIITIINIRESFGNDLEF